ncbi:MAG: hypothetical protein K0S08_152 [Gammaproteobacteria bacterium]|nr:hypothetical protein [Gammaproteobacteria bacterium]
MKRETLNSVKKFAFDYVFNAATVGLVGTVIGCVIAKAFQDEHMTAEVRELNTQTGSALGAAAGMLVGASATASVKIAETLIAYKRQRQAALQADAQQLLTPDDQFASESFTNKSVL